MTIEESIKKNPETFQGILDTKTSEIKDSLNDLSAKLDGIFNGAIREYCEKTGAEIDINSIPSYKTMNKMITTKLDTMIREHIQEKRKDL